MSWTEVFQKYSLDPTSGGGDPFTYLANEAAYAKTKGLPTTRVTCSPTSGADYGQLKCNFSITIECPQTDAHIMMAGEVAFRRAKQLLDDGSEDMGIPKT